MVPLPQPQRNDDVWTTSISNALTQDALERTYRMMVDGSFPGTEREEEDMTSIEVLVRELYSHEISVGGKQFVNSNLRMRKSATLGYSYVENLSPDIHVPAATNLLIMYFDGRLIVNTRIQRFLTDRAWRVLQSAITEKFRLNRELSDDMIKNYRLNIYTPTRPEVKGGRFGEYLKTMYKEADF